MGIQKVTNALVFCDVDGATAAILVTWNSSTQCAFSGGSRSSSLAAALPSVTCLNVHCNRKSYHLCGAFCGKVFF